MSIGDPNPVLVRIIKVMESKREELDGKHSNLRGMRSAIQK